MPPISGENMTVAKDSNEAEEARTAIVAALVRLNLVRVGDVPPMTPLTGGVSSDIWRVELADGPVCVKRALPQLRVAQLWEAPVERSLYEWRWMKTAARIAPGCVPSPIARDAEAGAIVMAYLAPDDHPLWKAVLRDGRTDANFAAAVAERLAAIHGTTAADPAMAEAFPTDDIFHAIRLEPYLVATGRAHPDLADALGRLVARTAATRRVLVHGDVSPKNILIGPSRPPGEPVFLDAECAWWGDPAFDLAFCLNHFLLKCLWTPRAAAGFLACFDRFADVYLAGVNWEPTADLEARAAALLPALFLARVDGKSPVEYVTEDSQRDRVRKVARPLVASPPDRLADTRDAWATELDLDERKT